VSIRFLEGAPLLPAPMAGIMTAARRLAFRRLGWPLCWVGSIDAHLTAVAGRPMNILGREEEISPRESPLVVQLIAAKAAPLRRAAALLEDRVDAFDFNLGCPLRTAVSKGMGAALLEEPDRAVALLESLVSATAKPVTAKIRLSPSGSREATVDLARRLESAGAAALVVHARTAHQGFSGEVDRETVAAVKKALRVPVIASGGVRNAADVTAWLEETGCDAVMVGSGAVRNPFLALDYRDSRSGRPPIERGPGDLAAFARLCLEESRPRAGRFAKPFRFTAALTDCLLRRLQTALFVRRHSS
jgi:tRNA-dihydrouridine synthase B